MARFTNYPTLLTGGTWTDISNEQLWAAIGALERQHALPTIFESFVTVDYKNTSKNALFINQASAANEETVSDEPQLAARLLHEAPISATDHRVHL